MLDVVGESSEPAHSIHYGRGIMVAAPRIRENFIEN